MDIYIKTNHPKGFCDAREEWGQFSAEILKKLVTVITGGEFLFLSWIKYTLGNQSHKPIREDANILYQSQGMTSWACRVNTNQKSLQQFFQLHPEICANCRGNSLMVCIMWLHKVAPLPEILRANWDWKYGKMITYRVKSTLLSSKMAGGPLSILAKA